MKLSWVVVATFSRGAFDRLMAELEAIWDGLLFATNERFIVNNIESDSSNVVLMVNSGVMASFRLISLPTYYVR